jgi:fibronectin-binding autotransporter adhesin
VTLSGGITTVTGSLAPGGGIDLTTGTLQIGSNGTAGSVSGPISNAGSVIFNRTDAFSYNGVISGTGVLVKQGSGILTLGGASTFTGATTLSAGTLLVNGSLGNTALTIANGARLGGSNGTIAGVVTSAAPGAIIAPGSSPGTLTVGSLDLTAGGTFEYELGTNSDLLNITGPMTGVGVLTFNFSNSGDIAPATPYTLFTFGSQSGLDYSDLVVGSLPASYTLDTSFGNGGWQINANNLQVQFIPEPSLTLLTGVGLLLTLKRRRA